MSEIFKEDMFEASRRWEAFHQKDIIGRPIVCVQSPKRNCNKMHPQASYHERLRCDIDYTIDKSMKWAANTFFGGEAMPCIKLSLGPDEIAAFCGADLISSDEPGMPQTSWSKPIISDWNTYGEIKISDDNPYWKRALKMYELAAGKAEGKMAMSPLDLHTNMDLLAALRGPEKLCMDLLDKPLLIDRLMNDTMNVFRKVWEETTKAGRMHEFGFYQAIYSKDGAAALQCDFAIMMSPYMFDRWVMPVLEGEAKIVKHVRYHWDGIGALVHKESILSSKGLYLIQFVPGAGNGTLYTFMDLLKEIQQRGKAVHIHGCSIDEIKIMHRELKPNMTVYSVNARNQDEAEDLLEWFEKNT